ncbi:MAG TPA: hypothetical protein VMI73_18950 [Trebonia sp.]|nr:hypothetical protein [Trebonia sp.]
MTELKDDLDRALRSVTFGEAPVERAIRGGRRLRNRRRLTVLASAVAIVAVAAGYPALTRNAASPPPVTGHTPSPSHTAVPHRDPAITSRPGTDVANSGVIARGTIGGAQWSVAISSGFSAHDQACYTGFVGTGSGPAARSAGQVVSTCATDLASLVAYAPHDPAGIVGSTGNASGSTTTYDAALGAVAPDVAYLLLRFTDGQELKLIPVTYRSHRYVAWLAPASMTVASLTAHLGGPHADNGQTMTAVPYDPPDALAVFGLWLKPGQAPPPMASGVIGGGTDHGRVWSESAYEGPWGTCIDSGSGDLDCVPLARLATTMLLGGWGGAAAGPVFGAAEPGVARLVIGLSDGTSADVTPIALGNERLFAFWVGKGVSPTGWTAFDAKGHMIAAERRLNSTLPG